MNYQKFYNTYKQKCKEDAIQISFYAFCFIWENKEGIHDSKNANETGKLYEEDIAEIKMMNNEQTELLKKALEVVIHLFEEDSKKRK